MLLDYHLTLVLVAAVLPVVLVFWYYKRLMKQYSEFPSCEAAVFCFLKLYLAGNVPTNIPLTGFILQFLNGLAKIFEKEGIFIVWIGQPMLFVFRQDAVKFFINEPAALDKSTKYDLMKYVMGTGLVTSNKEVSEKHRKIINPSFHRKLYRSYMAVYNRESCQLVQSLRQETEKPWIDIGPFLQACNFSILCETVVGLNEDSYVSGTSVKAYFKALETVADYTVSRFARPWLYYDGLLPLFSEGRKHLHKAEFMRNFSRQIVKDMLKSTEVNGEESPEVENSDFVSAKCKPFVQSFVEAHRKDPQGFTLEDIEYELSTFMIAGIHTSATAMTSAIHLLGLHPEVQEKVFNEIESVVEGELKYEDIDHLTYLESVIKETLRVLPTIPIFARRLRKEVQYGKYTVPMGTEIIFFPYALHKNQETFPNPEKFDPDRFSSDKMGQYSRYCYMPFSEGPRNCIGQNFAMIEMKVILTHILRNFKIVSLDPLDKIIFKWNIYLVTAESIRIQLIPRECAKTGL